MKFKHRFAYYLIGLVMGSFVVFFIFNKRGQDFCYLPNCRVLKDIRSKGMVISDEAKKKLDEKWVTIDDIKKCTEYGDIDFSRSNKKYKGGKIYIVEGRNTNNEPIEVEFVNYENKVMLKDIQKQ